MGYRILADATVVVHLAFIIYVVLGGILVIRWPRSAWLHVPAALWATAVELAGWFCPLTYLENHFRLQAGTSGYPGGFIDHYLIPVIYPGALTRSHQIFLGSALVVVNAVIYVVLATRRLRRPRIR